MSANQEFLQNIRTQLNEQDSSCIEQPIFIVYTKERFFGVDPDLHDAYEVWTLDDSTRIIDQDDLEFDALETLSDSDSITVDGTEYRKSYVTEIYRFRQAFFTRQAAQKFISDNAHNLRKPSVCIETLMRNNEMIQLRQILKDGV